MTETTSKLNVNHWMKILLTDLHINWQRSSSVIWLIMRICRIYWNWLVTEWCHLQTLMSYAQWTTWVWVKICNRESCTCQKLHLINSHLYCKMRLLCSLCICILNLHHASPQKASVTTTTMKAYTHTQWLKVMFVSLWKRTSHLTDLINQNSVTLKNTLIKTKKPHITLQIQQSELKFKSKIMLQLSQSKSVISQKSVHQVKLSDNSHRRWWTWF